MSLSFSEIRTLEEITLTAWPALQAVYDDGWVLRYAQGYTRRANSVNPLYPAFDDLNKKIARAEAFYTARGLPTVFKLTPASQDLDTVLAEQGYTAEAETSMQILDLANIQVAGRETVEIHRSLSDEWQQSFCRLNNVNERFVAPMRLMLPSIAPLTGYAAIRREGEIAAVGLGVCDRGYVGMFDIVTDARHRRQGIAFSLIASVLVWGMQNSAHHAYLQVMTNNEPALRLYDRLGFREVYRYWYRVKALA